MKVPRKPGPEGPGPGKPGPLVARPGYEVGYAKPPEGSKFRKGVSGNPRGRPKGSKNKLPALNEERMKAIILEEAYRTIKVREGTRNVTVPIARAVLRSLAVNAVKGQHRSQRLFSELLASVETSNKTTYDEWLKTAIDYKIEWDRELDRRKRLGITDAPPPLPHPDHVVIDIRAGTAKIIGPATREELAEQEKWIERRQMFEEELEDLQQALEDAVDDNELAVIRQEIGQTEKVLKVIRRALGEKE